MVLRDRKSFGSACKARRNYAANCIFYLWSQHLTNTIDAMSSNGSVRRPRIRTDSERDRRRQNDRANKARKKKALNAKQHVWYDKLDFVFPADTLLDAAECATRAIISLHITSVDRINNFVLDRVPGDVCVYFGRIDQSSCPRALEGNTDDVFAMSDYFSEYSHNGVPSHSVRVKK